MVGRRAQASDRTGKRSAEGNDAQGLHHVAGRVGGWRGTSAGALEKGDGAMREVRARRVYEEARPSDGRRVLVDRLWPRGLRKEMAHLDEWLKGVAPSNELRRWYGHRPARFAEFKRRYETELTEPDRAEALHHLRDEARTGPVTLLTATKDLEHSEAEVLVQLVRSG